MNYIISKKRGNAIFYSIVIMIVFLFFTLFIDWQQGNWNKEIILASLLLLLYQTWSIKTITGKLITPITVFLLLFYLFQNGYFLLYFFDINNNNVYFDIASVNLPNLIMFSSISSNLFALGGIILAKENGISSAPVGLKKMSYIFSVYKKEIRRLAFLGILICMLGVIPFSINNFILFLAGGYNFARDSVNDTSGVIGFLVYMYPVFSILYLVLSKGEESSKYKFRFILYSFIIWLLFTAISGNRTVGITGLVILYLLFNKGEVNKNKILKYIRLITMFIFISMLVPFISSYRVSGNIGEAVDYVFNNSLNFVILMISELGFSFFPLHLSMEVFPQQQDFLLGKGYIASFIAGIVPSSLDPTGYISEILMTGRIYSDIQTYFSYLTFGVGFSLNAEAYVNFGWFGLLSIFILSLIINYFLSVYRCGAINEKYGEYISLVMLFSWGTLVRRDSYYIWKAIMYNIVFINIYILLFIKYFKSHK